MNGVPAPRGGGLPRLTFWCLDFHDRELLRAVAGVPRLEELHRDSPFWEQHGNFREELDAMENVVRELRRRALDIRTTPVRRVLERMPRVVSELDRLDQFTVMACDTTCRTMPGGNVSGSPASASQCFSPNHPSPITPYLTVFITPQHAQPRRPPASLIEQRY